MPEEKVPTLYLSFDDGPHPEITPFVLELLRRYHAKASFFCIGKNVVAYPHIYTQILEDGHTVGNHTHNHLNGWKTTTEMYNRDIMQAADIIKSLLFRPPYGRIRHSQVKSLSVQPSPWTIYMWSILSADFDNKVTPEQCSQHVLTNLFPGAIVVFHDSEKAFDRLKVALPKVLEFCREHNWQLKSFPS